MTKFEIAAKSPGLMGITTAYCILAYLETHGITTFTDDEMKEFMESQGEVVEEWLKEERI